MTGVRLIRDDFGPHLNTVTPVVGQGEIGVPATANLNDGQRPYNASDYTDGQPSPRLPHAAMVARWRTLRCNICRRPLQRALLMPGSATLATCRRDRATFLFTVAESGALMAMRRG